MIDRETALGIAQGHLGRPPEDRDRPWGLEEFPEGWLITDKRPTTFRFRGASARVIERATGHIVGFPSAIGTERILTEYEKVCSSGFAQAGLDEPPSAV